MDARLYSPKDRTELWNSMVSLISAMALVIIRGSNLQLLVDWPFF